MLFKKKHQKSVISSGSGEVIQPSSKLSQEAPVKSNKSPKSLRPFNRKGLLFILIGLALIVVAGVFYKLQDSKKTDTNEVVVQRTETDKIIDEVNLALQAGDEKKALELANQALEKSPEDLYTLELAASLTRSTDPAAAKKIYAKALEIFIKNDDPNVDGKAFATYMAAAGLAENADKIEQAKLYYQKAIDSALPMNPLNEAIIKDAQERLAKLQ